ncbi:type II secretion system protein GspC [Pseudidiomarina tainanensis]|uniref:Type II secretion system protein GspC n=1 Tax=Pseudidiomarina tainanensis TaxID=502365 RepID=A0ACD2HJ46_9GAMM|nr:type II secretion system protein GspC [Pseudidiomarina tainanensis]RZQ56263.1 type II secretion system protein GspC [Pseudidiomarina tainanensis]
MQIQNTHVNALITAVCAVAAVWFGAQLTWQLITPASEVPSGPIQIANQGADTSYSARSIIALDLFGSASTNAPQASSNAPKTSLNIRLLGVSASNVPERSAAIIERSGNQEVYVVGDKLEGTQVLIKEIYADRVILDNNGRLETLELEGIGELSDGLSLTMANMSNAEVRTSGRAVRDGGSSPRRSDAPTEVTASAVNPESLLEYIQIMPVRGGSGIRGYRLSPGKNPELFRQAGFRDGDLAVAINGQDLTNISTAMKVTSELGDMTQATVTVLRGNEPVDLQLDIRDLPAEVVQDQEQGN